MSIIGQILWDVAPIFHRVRTEIVSNIQPTSSLANVMQFLTTLVSVCSTKAWARYSLIYGFASIWWNPEFDPVNKTFKKRLKGFNVWYTYQLVLIVSRTVFYYAISNDAAADPMAPKTLAAHSAALLVFSYVCKSTPLSRVSSDSCSCSNLQKARSRWTRPLYGPTRQRNLQISDLAQDLALQLVWNP